jgi:shikimate dehydrogenase
MSDKKICGVLGKPLGMSLSPIMHNTAFSKLDLEYEYKVFEVPPETLAHTLKNLRESNFRGLNVTHPYKITIMEHLDEVHEMAHEIGAVNTIVNEQGSLIGYNTDSYGAIKALGDHRAHLEGSGTKVLILGAGGAARAVSIPLARMGCEITIANRTFQRAQDLTNILMGYKEAKPVRWDEVASVIDKVDILINATPVGMKGGPEGSPVLDDLISPGLTVFDMVYNPMKTPLLLSASIVGAKIIYGYEMLVYQGAAAFELWTGVGAPFSVMKETVLKNLNTS